MEGGMDWRPSIVREQFWRRSGELGERWEEMGELDGCRCVAGMCILDMGGVRDMDVECIEDNVSWNAGEREEKYNRETVSALETTGVSVAGRTLTYSAMCV
jgi:hypothetical protein